MPPTWFNALVVAVGLCAGAIASVTGFGIGSLLTPTLGLQVGTKIAVAAVSIPHVAGTALRFWLLHERVDRRVLLTFGLTSAAGGLTGALLHEWMSSPWLTVVFGALLLLVATSELTGLAQRARFRGPAAWIAGAISGLLGGLVGNQGGIRSAALLGTDLPKQTFVATATAVGLIVDGARMPVYLATTGHEVVAVWPPVAAATVGVLAGTLLGHRLLARIPETRFRPIVSVILGVLGAAMIVNGFSRNSARAGNDGMVIWSAASMRCHSRAVGNSASAAEQGVLFRVHTKGPGTRASRVRAVAERARRW
jgi:uncharacterized membrane protein YfcA